MPPQPYTVHDRGHACAMTRDGFRLCILPVAHPYLLERWEFSTSDTGADTVFSVQQPSVVNYILCASVRLAHSCVVRSIPQ
jgi:hypothetical protein